MMSMPCEDPESWSLQDDLDRGRVAVHCGGKRVSPEMFYQLSPPNGLSFFDFFFFDPLGYPSLFDFQPLRGINLCTAFILSPSGLRIQFSSPM
jgi:hypothetical protein